MANSYRLDQICSYLIHCEKASVEELAEEFKVTPTTIRRDLLVLEEQGLIIRSRGYASLNNSPHHSFSYLADEKHRIAQAACKMVSQDMSIALDSGTTITTFAECLCEQEEIQRLNIVTHSPQLAILTSESYNVSLLGGSLLPRTDFVVGFDAEEHYKNIHVDLAFLGSTSVHDCAGLTVNNPLQLNVKRYAAMCASKRIALLDSSKYVRHGIYVFCNFSDLDTLITVETEENRSQLDRIAQYGVNIVTV